MTRARAALRKDPDVILRGEMRDLETISLALTALRNQIREGKVPQLPQTIELGRRAGMQTMTQAIQELAAAGRITRQTRDATLAALGGDNENG